MSQSQLPEFWLPESVKAWRLFGARSGILPTLTSVTMSHVTWHRSMQPSKCVSPWAALKEGAHDAPAELCLCGYWSLKPEWLNRVDEWKNMTPWTMEAAVTLGAVGWVEQWGEIIEGEYGYRSEHIKLTALIDLPDDVVLPRMWPELGDDQVVWASRILAQYRDRLEKIADLFQVPVVMMQDAETQALGA